MIRALLILLGIFLLMTSEGRAQEEILQLQIPSHRLSDFLQCSEEQHGGIVITHGRQEYTTYFGAFASTPILSQSTVCRRFLVEWGKKLAEQKPEPIHLQLIGEGADEARAEVGIEYQLQSAEMLAACRELGFCTVTWFDRFTMHPQIRSCLPQVSWRSLWYQARPRFMKANYRIIPKVEIELFPFSPLTTLFKDFSDRHSAEMVLASTMSLGRGAATQLARQEDEKPRLIAIDASDVIQSDAQATVPEEFGDSSTVGIVPMTSGAFFDTNFHWKAMVGTSSDESVLSSMNFSTPSRARYFDLSYRFYDQEVTAELRAHLMSAIQEQCAAINDLNCLVDFAVTDKELQSKWKTLLTKACAKFQSYRAASANPPDNVERFFMQPQDTDLESLTIEMIDRASKEIVILTHQFNLTEVNEALSRAANRGVKVHLFETKGIKRMVKEPYVFTATTAKISRRLPEPHMKTMVIDRETLFFGTGNFTRSGFQGARELFAITKDQVAIEEVLRVAAAFYRSIKADSQETFGLADAESYFLVPTQLPEIYKPGSIERATWSRLSEMTTRLNSNWLSSYLQVKREYFAAIRRCGLGHVQLLVQDDFIRCVAHHGDNTF